MYKQNSERKAIFISKFWDPYCFYFKFTDEKFNEQLKLLEEDLANHAWAKIKDNNYSNSNIFEPKLNDVIAVYNSSWSKWVRAVVKNVSICSAGLEEKQYILWAIDHGQYIKSYDKKSFVPLPTELRSIEFLSAYQGSIHGYEPAILKLNAETLDEKMVPTKKWSPRAIKMCSELIEKCSIVYFEVKSTRCGYLFGDLSFEMPDKRLIFLEKYLWDLREIMKGDFYEEIIVKTQNITFMPTTINTTNIIRKMNNSPYISSELIPGTDKAIQKNSYQLKNLQHKRGNRNVHERPQAKNCIEVQNVQIVEHQMSVLESEIDGGITRIKMNKRL